MNQLKDFSQEQLDKFDADSKLFRETLTEEEAKLLTFIHLHGSEENRLPDQDLIERGAKKIEKRRFRR